MENYLTAAIKHLHDAELLMKSGRIDNAGHLIGFAGECAIKHKISTINTGVALRVHLPVIKEIALRHINNRSSMFNLLKGSIYHGWDVNQRYCGNGVATATQVNTWIIDTKRLFATAGIKDYK